MAMRWPVPAAPRSTQRRAWGGVAPGSRPGTAPGPGAAVTGAGSGRGRGGAARIEGGFHLGPHLRVLNQAGDISEVARAQRIAGLGLEPPGDVGELAQLPDAQILGQPLADAAALLGGDPVAGQLRRDQIVLGLPIIGRIAGAARKQAKGQQARSQQG